NGGGQMTEPSKSGGAPPGAKAAFTNEQVNQNQAQTTLEQGGALIQMCHKSGDQWGPMSVAQSAVQSHVEQGDIFPPCPTNTNTNLRAADASATVQADF